MQARRRVRGLRTPDNGGRPTAASPSPARRAARKASRERANANADRKYELGKLTAEDLAGEDLAGAGAAVQERAITSEELHAQAPELVPHGSAEAAGARDAQAEPGPAGRSVDGASSLHAAAEAAAAGDEQAAADAAAEPAPSMGPDELVGLAEMGKGMLVHLLATTWKVDLAQHPGLDAIAPETKAILRTFAPQLLSYMPALNANAPLVGAACFVGILGMDLLRATSTLKSARAAASERKSDARDVLGLAAHGLPEPTIIGRVSV